jgi:hypothetical protein
MDARCWTPSLRVERPRERESEGEAKVEQFVNSGMHVILFYVLPLFWIESFAPSDLSDRLCGDNEEIILSFKTKNQKVISICKEKKGKYLVYRFGTTDKIELQFPGKPDHDSWKQFHYRGAWRFGGKANAGFGDLVLRFKNVNTTYRLFEEWNDEDGSADLGLEVETAGTKAKKIVIDKSSRMGSLMRLNDVTQINNEQDEE